MGKIVARNRQQEIGSKKWVRVLRDWQQELLTASAGLQDSNSMRILIASMQIILVTVKAFAVHNRQVGKRTYSHI
jgi:hypothetical protein